MFDFLKKLNKKNTNKKQKEVKDTVTNPMEGAIVLLDMGITNISIINKLHEKFPLERFCFINDLEYGEYEGHDEMDIKSRIKKIIEFINQNKPKMLFVLNSVYIEYGSDLFNGLTYPVLNMIKTVVEVVNTKYEFKSIGFIANDGMVEANIYQKAFHYNHLYNKKANNLIELANNQFFKTKESFNALKDLNEEWSKRDVEVIVTPELNLLLFYTEFNEYFKGVDLVKADDAVVSAIENELAKLEPRKQKDGLDFYIYTNVTDQYRDKESFRKLLNQELTYAYRDYKIQK